MPVCDDTVSLGRLRLVRMVRVLLWPPDRRPPRAIGPGSESQVAQAADDVEMTDLKKVALVKIVNIVYRGRASRSEAAFSMPASDTST